MPVTQNGEGAHANFGTFNDFHFQLGGTPSSEAEKEEKVLEGLKTKLNPQYITHPGRRECLKEMRVELMNEIDAWFQNTEKPNVLFLLGGAGTGKSTIASTVADRYPKQVGSEQYFARGKSYPAFIFQTMAYDLARHDQVIASTIKAELDKFEIQFATPKKSFEVLIDKPLGASESAAVEKNERRGNVLIILDALDECGNQNSRERYIDLIKDGLPKLPARYRFLVTSRPESDIVPSNPDIVTISVENEQDIQKDVLAYIKNELKGFQSTLGASWEGYTNDLGTAAGGLFIWATTAVEMIKRGRSDIEGELKRLLTKKLLSLQGLYETALDNSLMWNEETRKSFSNVLSLIMFGKEKLLEKEVSQLLNLKSEKTRSILESLRSLLVFDPLEPEKPIVYHASLCDYLTSESTRGKPWFIDEKVQKDYIANICFDVMKKKLQFNICELETSFTSNQEDPKLLERISEKIPWSLQYACRNWALHLREAILSDELLLKLESFAFYQLLFWLEVLSVTEKLSRGLVSLVYAVACLEDKHSRLKAFLQDAHLQLSVFLQPMSESTPHIYMTFLPLMKGSSVVADHYAKQGKRLAHAKYSGERPHKARISKIDIKSFLHSISFSQDGSQIVTGSSNGSCIWDVVSGTLLLGPLQRGEGDVSAVAFSKEGKRIVSALCNGEIAMWDTTNDKIPPILFERHSKRVSSVAFSPDGKHMASSSDDKTVCIWNVESGTLVGDPLEGHDNSVDIVQFTPEGSHLLSCSKYGTTICWNPDTRKAESKQIHDKVATNIALSPDNEKIVLGSSRKITLFDVSPFRHKQTFTEEGMADVKSVAISYDNAHILSGHEDGIIRMWKNDAKDVTPRRYKGHTSAVCFVCFSPNGLYFVSGSEYGIVRVWDMVGEEENEDPSIVNAIAISPNGKHLVSSLSGNDNGSVYLWDIQKGQLIKKLEGHTLKVKCVAFSPDSRLFASGSEDGTVRVWNVEGTLVTCNKYSDSLLESISSVSFSRDGLHFTSTSDDTLKTWYIDIHSHNHSASHSGTSLAVPTEFEVEDGFGSFVYTPDGKKIASASSDKNILIWDATTGEQVLDLQGHSASTVSINYSYDGYRIVSASNNEIIVWNAETGQVACGPIQQGATSVCFSTDGKWLASALSTIVYLWDASSGNPLFQACLSTYVKSVDCFPATNSKFIDFATTSNDGAIRIWSLSEDSRQGAWMNDDGWLKRNKNDLLIWTPKNLRRSLLYGPCIRTLNAQFSTEITFSGYEGDKWVECFPHPNEKDESSENPSLSAPPSPLPSPLSSSPPPLLSQQPSSGLQPPSPPLSSPPSPVPPATTTPSPPRPHSSNLSSIDLFQLIALLYYMIFMIFVGLALIVVFCLIVALFLLIVSMNRPSPTPNLIAIIYV